MTAGSQTNRPSIAERRPDAAKTTSGIIERSSAFAEARFFFGLAGLVVSVMAVGLTLWATVPVAAFNWSSVVITSGSMAPSIAPGDVVVASPSDGHGLAPGTVVVFHDAAWPGLVTHRIVAVNDDGTYQTRGDANESNDSTPVSPDQVVGAGKILIPLAGLPALWLRNGAWAAFGMWVAGMVLALWSARFALLDRYDPWLNGGPGDIVRTGTVSASFDFESTEARQPQ
jgi:signal peptidase I